MRKAKEWIDLSQPLDERTLAYPGDPQLTITAVGGYARDGYLLSQITSGMHLGTHIDFPSHFLPGGKTCMDYPPYRFIGMGAKVTVTPRLGVIATSDIADGCRQTSGPSILVLETGHGRLWNDERYYSECPVFEDDLGAFLQQAGITLFFTDLPTVRYRDGERSAMHRELLGQDILIGENLRIPSDLGREFEFIALPLPLNDIEASIVRAVAKNI